MRVGGGDRGAGTRENWGREVGEERAESGREEGGKRDFAGGGRSAGQRSRGENGGKVRRERKVREPGEKGTGSGKFIPPCPPYSQVVEQIILNVPPARTFSFAVNYKQFVQENKTFKSKLIPSGCEKNITN